MISSSSKIYVVLNCGKTSTKSSRKVVSELKWNEKFLFPISSIHNLLYFHIMGYEFFNDTFSGTVEINLLDVYPDVEFSGSFPIVNPIGTNGSLQISIDRCIVSSIAMQDTVNV